MCSYDHLDAALGKYLEPLSGCMPTPNRDGGRVDPPAGHVTDGHHGILGARGEGVSGSELVRAVELLVEHIDPDDGIPPCQGCPLDGIQSYASTPEHRDTLPWVHLRRVRHRAKPAVTEQPIRAARSSGKSSLARTATASRTTTWGPWVAGP